MNYEKLNKLEVGKDYIDLYSNELIVIDRKGDKNNRGFAYSTFKNTQWCNGPIGWREATKEEVVEAFKKHLVYRYGEDWETMKIKKAHPNQAMHLNKGLWLIEIDRTFYGWCVWNKNGLLYCNGIWVERLEEESTDWTPAPEDIAAMKQELTITPPSGFEIDEEKSTFQKIVFRKIEKKFPTKLEEIDRHWYIGGNGIIFKYEGTYNQTLNQFTSKESAEQALEFIKLLAFRDAIWEIEGKPENEKIDISFNFKTIEGLAHFYKMKKEIDSGMNNQ